MATENEECKGLRVLDPVQGLLDYIRDVKPFHTKIVEVLVEYVYDEPLEVTVLEDYLIDIEVVRPYEIEQVFNCTGGYSYVPFGGPKAWPILSPNQDVSFEDYPAVDPSSRSVVVSGDRARDMKEDDKVELVSHIDDTTGLCKISEVGPTYFIVQDLGIHGISFAAHFAGWTDFVFTTGMPRDDGKGFKITGIIPDTPVVGFTRVDVDNTVVTPQGVGHFGLVKYPGDNTGIYTVEKTEFRGGSNDIWTDPLDFMTYQVGDDPHTILTVKEPLSPLTTLAANQSHGMVMKLLPIGINRVLSYSNISNLPTNTPDEGYIMRDVLAVTQSSLDIGGAPIPGSGTFTVPGNLSASNIFADEWVRVTESTANNGVYTITHLSYNAIDDETTIGVNERVRDDTADGKIRIDIPSNMFYVDGDHTQRFRQGVSFNVTGGNFQGEYMTLYSDFVNGKTRIRPNEEILNVGRGAPIQDILSSDTFVVSRDKTHKFITGRNLNIVNSSSNDGMYEIASATYDPVDDLTTIVVVEAILDLTVDGEVFHTAMGIIKEVGAGYSVGSDFCDYHPETHIDVRFIEEFRVEGVNVNFHNHLIAYNMENDDWWGIDIPLGTNVRYSPKFGQPPVFENPTPPGTPERNDFWFNTDEGQLYRWDTTETTWIPEKTIYWLDACPLSDTDPNYTTECFNKTLGERDESTHFFYYRTMYDEQTLDRNVYPYALGPKVRVDTGWTQLFANPPGWSDVQPAQGTLNAHVTSWDSDPHRKHHKVIDVDDTNDSDIYYLDGGNMIHRFHDSLRIERWDTTTNGSGFLGLESPVSFEITNVSGNEMTIEGVYDFFFEAGNIIGVDVWNDTYHEMVIVGVTATATDTMIEVSPADIAQFQGLTTTYGSIYGAVYEMPSGTVPVPPPTGAEIFSYSYVEPHRIHTLTTDAVIKENFKIDWGSRYAWVIIETDSGANTITVDGDISGYLNTTKLFITNSQGNDGEYDIVSHTLVNDDTVVTVSPALPVDPPQGHLGFLQIEDTSVVNWFQFSIVSATAASNEFVVNGDATNDIPNGGDFRVIGTSNDGTYTATAAPTYNGGLDRTTIQVASIANNDTGGWVEHV